MSETLGEILRNRVHRPPRYRRIGRASESTRGLARAVHIPERMLRGPATPFPATHAGEWWSPHHPTAVFSPRLPPFAWQ
jgi:hypothetical protein